MPFLSHHIKGAYILPTRIVTVVSLDHLTEVVFADFSIVMLFIFLPSHSFVKMNHPHYGVESYALIITLRMENLNELLGILLNGKVFYLFFLLI